MPHDAEILGLKDYEIKDIYRDGSSVIIEARYTGRVSCPHCASRTLRKKDRFIRKLRHENIGERHGYLHLESLKFRCEACGRYFNQRFPGIRERCRSTEIFRRYISRLHFDGVCRKRLAQRQKIGTATVERWFQEFLHRKESEMSAEECPRILGIDEHFFTKRKGYATTFCDLDKHKVYDVVLGRSERSLEGYLGRLKGKERVELVCIDLSSSYRTLVRKHFPNAQIVADRFHVIRLINQHFMATWRSLDETGSKNRGLISLMRRHAKNLKPEQRERLRSYFTAHPEIGLIYEFKQRLAMLLTKKSCTAKQCRKMIPKLIKFIAQLRSSRLGHLETLGATLDSWSGEVAAMWRFTKNNGITEGFHNKMEMLSRMAYGFRNFENYRLRVRVMCS